MHRTYRDEFWKDIEGFVSNLGIDRDIYEQLLHYQKSILRLPGVSALEISTEYDFYSYFENIYDDCYKALEKKKTTLCIELEKQIDSWADYAREIIWFGKRRSATLCTNSREKIEVKH